MLDEAKGLPCCLLPATRNPAFSAEKKSSKDKRTIDSTTLQIKTVRRHCTDGGGIGKSQVTLHYTPDHMVDFDNILWFHAQTEDNFDSSFCDAAVRLQLHEAR
jgi:hypothetical protein